MQLLHFRNLLLSGTAAAIFGDGGSELESKFTYCKGTLHKPNNTELVQDVCTTLKRNWIKVK